MDVAETCRQKGNDLLQRGDFADAAKHYDEGLVALLTAQDEQVPQLRAALHLNASLAHLRRGNLGSAIDHATGALASDAQCVKALYRRGLARRRLAEHQNEQQNLQLAQEDFEKALQLEPSNAEVRQQLQQLKDLQRQERRALNAQQGSSGFRNIFSKQLYDTESPKPVLRETQGKEKPILVSTSALSFDYDEPVLSGVDVDLRVGRCLGLVGLNASGKTTLARLLRKQLRPKAGSIQHHFGAETPTAGRRWTGTAATSVAILVAVIAAMVPFSPSREAPGPWQLVALGVAVAALVLVLLLSWGPGSKQHLVLHLSSETSDKDFIKPSRTIESVIGDDLPKMSAEQRRQRVTKMLQAGGFQMYNQETGEPIGNPMEYIRDGLQFGKLSGGQQHLIYILKYLARCLAQISDASNPSVLLVCDEVLSGLDSIRQPRVLQMLKQLQETQHVGLLYITTELHQLHIMADDLAFLHGGVICELGPAAEVLQLPKHPATKDYVSQFRGLPGGHTLGGKLAESYARMADDEKLKDWMA